MRATWSTTRPFWRRSRQPDLLISRQILVLCLSENFRKDHITLLRVLVQCRSRLDIHYNQARRSHFQRISMPCYRQWKSLKLGDRTTRGFEYGSTSKSVQSKHCPSGWSLRAVWNISSMFGVDTLSFTIAVMNVLLKADMYVRR